MLTAAIIMGLMSTYTEIKLVHGSATIRKIYTKGIGPITAVWINTIGSVFLSWVMGALFSATGTTVAIAAAISTGLSQAYFNCESFLSGKEFNLKRYTNGIRDFSHGAQNLWSDFRQPLADLTKIILWTLRIITLPIVLMRKAAIAYNGRG